MAIEKSPKPLDFGTSNFSHSFLAIYSQQKKALKQLDVHS
jgi:hypothetical protein